MTQVFSVGISSDFKSEAPGRLEPILAKIFDPLDYVTYRYFDASGSDEDGAFVTAADIAGFDAVLSLGVRYTAATFSQANQLAVIARWGVGYDMIDVPACTENDVLLAITVDAVRRPVSEAILTLMLSLAKQMPAKDKIVRTGRWDLRAQADGLGLRGKVVGTIGLGSIAKDMFTLLAPFELGRKLAADPFVTAEDAAAQGVELVDLPTLFAESDFVTVNCFLNEETQGLVNADLLARMKPSAFLINTARGPIVNQADLIAALQAGQLAGAGLDVFEAEPLDLASPLVEMENVILSPHSLAWTDELYHDNGVGACENILTILRGEVPKYTVNRAVVDRAGFEAKLADLRGRGESS